MQEHIEAIIAAAGLKPEDVHEFTVSPGVIAFTCWARDEDGSIATIDSGIGSIPLMFVIKMSYGTEPPHDHDHDHDHEHGPHTHTHDDLDA